MASESQRAALASRRAHFKSKAASRRALKPPGKRRRRAKPPPPPQRALWPAPPRLSKARAAAAAFTALRSLGRALLATEGTLAVMPTAPKVAPLLAALDASVAVRRVVGRLDISGSTQSAASATLTMDGPRATLRLIYRHGLETLQDLAHAALAVAESQGWRAASIGPRIGPASQHGSGCYGATIALSPAPGTALFHALRAGPILAR